MAKNMQPILKRCRTLGISPAVMGIDKTSNRNPNPMRKKQSEYGRQLTEKQKEEWDKTIPYYDAYVKYNEQVFSEGGNVEAAENYLCMRQINKLVEK